MKPTAQRVQKIAPYLFARIEQKIAEAKAQGIDIISLGIGDPDRPTPDFIIEEMNKEIRNSVNHQYPSSQGMLEFPASGSGLLWPPFPCGIRRQIPGLRPYRFQGRDRQYEFLLYRPWRY